MRRDSVPGTAYVTGWDRAAVVGLGTAGCVLSFSALQQMAVAIHVRPALCWLFPLAIDGFIAYGVRALLVLRAAPLRARLYVWLLFGTATAVSVWANALHAVRLNQETTAVTGLRLGDQVVAVLSTVAPLALAGAVHLYILIARGPDSRPPVNDPDHFGQPDTAPAVRTDRDSPLSGRSTGSPVTAAVRAGDRRPALGRDNANRKVTERPDQPVRASHTSAADADRSRIPGDRHRPRDTEHLLAIARRAVVTEEKLTRRVVAEAIRGQNIPLSNDTLTQLMAHLRQQPGRSVTVSRN